MRGNAPPGKRVCALEVYLDALFDEALTVAPFVHAVREVRVEDLHRCTST